MKKGAIPTVFEYKPPPKKGKKKAQYRLPPPPCPTCTEKEMLDEERRDLKSRSVKREPNEDHNYVNFGVDDQARPARFSMPDSMISNVVSVPRLPDSSLKDDDEEYLPFSDLDITEG